MITITAQCSRCGEWLRIQNNIGDTGVLFINVDSRGHMGMYATCVNTVWCNEKRKEKEGRGK